MKYSELSILGIASATQILVSHMFGDAFSPYLIGALADAFKPMISPSNSTVVPDPVTELGVTEESDIGTFLGSSPFGSQHSSPSPEEYDLEFRALEYSLFTCRFFQVNKTQIGGNRAHLNLIH